MTTATRPAPWTVYEAMQLAVSLVLETVTEMPDGAPSGVIYSILNQHGMQLHIYQQMISALERAGKIHVEHDLIYPGPA